MILAADITNPSKEAIEKAVETLKEGNLVVYPTDTAYGLGVDATNKAAVEKLYEVKGRDFSKPTHVVVSGWEMIVDLCEVNEAARKIYEAFMPGPITLILKDKGKVDQRLGAGSGTLGVRMPNCELTKKMAKQLGRPFTTPSANRSGGKTPYIMEEVRQELDLREVKLILDGGDLKRILPSTVVDLSEGELRVLREGPISGEKIEEVLR